MSEEKTRINFAGVSDVPMGCLIRRGFTISCRHLCMTSVEVTIKAAFIEESKNWVNRHISDGNLEEALKNRKNEIAESRVSHNFVSTSELNQKNKPWNYVDSEHADWQILVCNYYLNNDQTKNLSETDCIAILLAIED